MWGPEARPDKKQQLQPGQRGGPQSERASDDNRNTACSQSTTKAASCKTEGLVHRPGVCINKDADMQVGGGSWLMDGSGRSLGERLRAKPAS